MDMASAWDNLFQISALPDIAETGGAHNQRATDFQRYWSIAEMVALELSGSADYLFLFEAFQDVAILDAELNPSRLRIYQIKKKDRNEWTWAELTRLPIPGTSKRGKLASLSPYELISSSAIGKLYAAVRACTQFDAEGTFLSNAGCDIPLSSGDSAATTVSSKLSALDAPLASQLASALVGFHQEPSPTVSLDRLGVAKTEISVSDPHRHVLGIVSQFIGARSPDHASQSKPFLDALVAQVGVLGGRTEKCTTPTELRTRHGYSRAQFLRALQWLEATPDLRQIWNDWLNRLASEGTPPQHITRIRLAHSRALQARLAAAESPEALELETECDAWLARNACGASLRDFISAAVSQVGRQSGLDHFEIVATILWKAVQSCADQTSENSYEA